MMFIYKRNRICHIKDVMNSSLKLKYPVFNFEVYGHLLLAPAARAPWVDDDWAGGAAKLVHL